VTVVDANSTLSQPGATVAVLADDARASKPVPRRQVFVIQKQTKSHEQIWDLRWFSLAADEDRLCLS
jgi:hypothetical protein